MKNPLKIKNLFIWLIVVITAGTLVAAVLLLLLPLPFKPDADDDTIKNEMIDRVENIAMIRDTLTFISFTPFMWDEGYYFDHTVNEEAMGNITESHIGYKQLAEDDQRLVFFFQGQLIADLTIERDEMVFDITPGPLDKLNGWLNIGRDSDGLIRLYE